MNTPRAYYVRMCSRISIFHAAMCTPAGKVITAKRLKADPAGDYDWPHAPVAASTGVAATDDKAIPGVKNVIK